MQNEVTFYEAETEGGVYQADSIEKLKRQIIDDCFDDRLPHFTSLSKWTGDAQTFLNARAFNEELADDFEQAKAEAHYQYLHELSFRRYADDL